MVWESLVVVKSKPAVLADPVPPDIVEGRGDRSDPSQSPGCRIRRAPDRDQKVHQGPTQGTDSS